MKRERNKIIKQKTTSSEEREKFTNYIKRSVQKMKDTDDINIIN